MSENEKNTAEEIASILTTNYFIQEVLPQLSRYNRTILGILEEEECGSSLNDILRHLQSSIDYGDAPSTLQVH